MLKGREEMWVEGALEQLSELVFGQWKFISIYGSNRRKKRGIIRLKL